MPFIAGFAGVLIGALVLAGIYGVVAGDKGEKPGEVDLVISARR